MTEKEKVQGFSLKDKTAGVIGCGGLGCNIAVHLAGAGIGKMILCDFDKISQSNLNRQFLYTAADIGLSKCEVAAKRLSEYSEGTSVITAERKILHTDDMTFCKECDIIISAVDNAGARRVLQEFCFENNIPLVCGGLDGFYGMAYLYLPGISPCPDCAGLNTQATAKANISATAGIIGSTQAALAIQYLISQEKELSGKLLIYDGGVFDTLTIRPSQSCTICQNRN